MVCRMIVACTRDRKTLTVAVFDDRVPEPVFRYQGPTGRIRTARVHDFDSLSRGQRAAVRQAVVQRALAYVRFPCRDDARSVAEMAIQRCIDFAKHKHVDLLPQLQIQGVTVILPRQFDFKQLLDNAVHVLTSPRKSWHLAVVHLLNDH